jgi:PAS domain S-box-containing protein
VEVEALTIQAARLAAIVDSSDDAIISKDLDGVVTSWNGSAERIFGYTAAEMIGTPIARLVPADRPNEEPAILERIRRGVRVDHYETVRRRKDGSLVDVSVTVSPIRDADDRIVGASKVARDVTGQRLLEAELRCQAADLVTQHEQKDQFLAMLAHELRNPLAPVLNAVEVLHLRSTNDPVIQRQHAIIERQTRQMARLLDDLLDISRITRGRIELRMQTLELGELAAQAVETARPSFEQRAQLLTLALPESPVYLCVDAARMHQILSNLLTNASKYTPFGGRIAVTVERDEAHGHVRVVDNGQGISPEVLSHVFELFVQEDRSISRGASGLGIGLTMVQRLVQLHGGSVAVRSEGPGRGSEFQVSLPLAAVTDQPEQATPETPGSPDASGRRILIVDDNRDAAETLADLAELWGYHVRVVNDGTVALQAAREFNPEIILLDISMPGISGYEVAEAVRRQEQLNSTVLFALTGYGQEEDRRRTREAGFDHHLTKPVDPNALRLLLENTAVEPSQECETV